MDEKISLAMSEKQIELEKEKLYSDYRAFRHKVNVRGKDLHIKIKKTQEKMKKNLILLKQEFPKKQFTSLKKRIKQFHKSNTIEEKKSPISKKYKNYLNSTIKYVNYLKNENIELSRLNELNLHNISQKLLSRPHSAISILKNKNLNELTNKIQNSSLRHLKKVNIGRINDNLRKTINLGFIKYNPISNLKDLYYIKKNNSYVKENFEKMKTKMNNKIKDEIDGKFYKKKYEKIVNQNLKKNNESSTQRDIPRSKSTGFYSLNTSKKFYQKKMLKEKEQKEFELMEDTIEPLYNTLDITPILKYIDDTVNEKNRDKNNINEKKNIYFPDLQKTAKSLSKLNKYKKEKENEKDNKETFQIIDYDEISLYKRYEECKEQLIKAFNKRK